MLNKEKHQLLMGQILRDIYTDTSIAPLLGFKGGTCAYFFYNLPRFSVDLDFDLLSIDEETQKTVMEKIRQILEKYGKVKDEKNKKFTLFFLLSYADVDHNIKVEINTRSLVPEIKKYYELKEFLGISMLVAKKSYLFSSKLMALTERTEITARDVYDVYFFGKENCDLDPEILKIRSKKSVRDYLSDCIKFVEEMENNRILHGLGELMNEKEKDWIRKNLKKEAVFLLKNYQAVLK